METNEGKYNYHILRDFENKFDDYLSNSRSFKDYLDRTFEQQDLLTKYIKAARDDKDVSDKEFIENYYYERYSNKEVSNNMATIVLGKPGKIAILIPGFQELKVSTRDVQRLNYLYFTSFHITDDLVIAFDSNLNVFDEEKTFTTKEIRKYAENNQLKFINSIQSRSYSLVKEGLQDTINEDVNRLKNIYSKDGYFDKLYDHACKKTRESLTDEKLKRDAREFKVETIQLMKTGLEEFSADYEDKKDPGVVEIVIAKRLEKRIGD